MNIKDPDFKKGIRAGMPVAVGYFPIAIAFGALADQAQLTLLEGVLMSILVYAGASQFVGVSLLLAGTGNPQIITATFFLNLRHLIMSLAVNDQMRDFSGAWKRRLSFFITDETFALLTLGDVEDTKHRTPQFMAGLLLTAYFGWVSGTLVGGLGAGFIPPQITTAMTLGLYGLFIGLLIPSIKKSNPFAVIAVLSMVLNWGLSQWVESGWAIVIATVLAAGAGIPLVGGDE
jgi:4-azaleucine resistance transporter AzlC